MSLTRRDMLLSVVAAASVPGLVRAGSRAEGPICAELGRAIRGTDPVAYFSDGRPVEGLARYATKWMGAVWQFASADNREAFEMNPRAYAPQYGGYCAWAVCQNFTAQVDPQAWQIVDGRLFLTSSPRALALWSEDESGNIARGDANWPGLLKGLTG